MSVERRGARYRIRWREGDTNRSHTCAKGTTKREAEAIETEILAAVLRDGTWQEGRARGGPATLGELLDEYKAERAADGAKDSTRRLYDTVLDPFVRFCRGRAKAATVAHLDRAHVVGFLASRDVQQSSRATYAKVIRAFWRWAADAYPDHVEAVRMPRVKNPPPKVVIAPSWGQIDRMLGQLTSRASWALRAGLIERFVGFRIGQIGRLQETDYTPNLFGRHGPALRLQAELGKSAEESRQDRWVPVDGRLAALIESWPSSSSGLLIGQAPPRDPHETYRGAWRRAGVPSDFWHGHPSHAIRRRLQSHLVERGLARGPIDHLVGHAPQGVRARHYVDPLAWFPLLREALATIPDYGATDGPDALPRVPVRRAPGDQLPSGRSAAPGSSSARTHRGSVVGAPRGPGDPADAPDL